MGIEFEKLKINFPIDLPVLVKQGRVRGNKNIFKVGLNMHDDSQLPSGAKRANKCRCEPYPSILDAYQQGCGNSKIFYLSRDK